MSKSKKITTLLLALITVTLSIFTVGFATVSAEEPETQMISVLDTGAVNFVLHYDGDPTKVDEQNAKNFIPEGGVKSYDESVEIKSTWAGDMGLYQIYFYAIIDLSGTPYEDYKKVTISVNNISLVGEIEDLEKPLGFDENGCEIYEKVPFSGVNHDGDYSCCRMKTNSGSVALTDSFEYSTSKQERVLIYNTENLFEVLFYGQDVLEEVEVPPLEADLEVTFNVACYVEIETSKIKQVENNEPEESAGAIENWLNSAGDKISSFIESNVGIAVGGTSSILVVFVIAMIFLRRRRR